MLPKKLAISIELFDTILSELRDSVTLVDPNLEDNPLVYVNRAFEITTGYTKEEVLNKNCRFLQCDDQNQPEIQVLREALKKGEPCQVVLKNYRKTGERFWNELSISPIRSDEGEILYFLGIQKDITQKVDLQKQLVLEMCDLRDSNKNLKEQAETDALTGLHNKRYFLEQYPAQFTFAQRNNLPFSLFMMDVDHFKAYNDFYGHIEGDHCLEKVGQALRCVFKRNTDIVARYGGEEFAVFSVGGTALFGAKLAKKFQAEIERLNIEHQKSEHEYITFSIGHVFVQDPAVCSHLELLDIADQALYAAKSKGRHCIVQKIIE